MSSHPTPSYVRLPQFGLITPTQWTRVDTRDDKEADEIAEQIVTRFPDQNATRIRQDVRDFERSLLSENVTQYFTYVEPAGEGAILLVLLCAIAPIRTDSPPEFQDVALEVLQSMDQGWDAPQSMLTMHESEGGEYLRAERLVEEGSTWPWPITREIRYVFGHPDRSAIALLTAMSPNTEVPAIFELFDRVAATFFWLPT